jgi:HK97 gp10 family phage protein
MSFHSSGLNTNFEGFEELQQLLIEEARKVDKENLKQALLAGAAELASDANKLPKPISRINSPGYTHLLSSISARMMQGGATGAEVGWGKFYGRMVEKGTSKMAPRAHLIPLFERNAKNYYQTIVDKINL